MGRRRCELRVRCDALGLDYQNVKARINNGWSLEDALSIKISNATVPKKEYVFDMAADHAISALGAMDTAMSSIKAMQNRIRIQDRIIGLIKSDGEGRKIYERALKEIVG